MRFGTISAGAGAQAIGGHLVAAGYPVTLSGRRGPDGLQDTIARLGPLATAGSVADAAAADMVFLTVMWPDIGAAVRAGDWDGRILIDTTNQFGPAGGQLRIVDTAATLGIPTGSEVLACLAPGARVIKAFNTISAPDTARDRRQETGRRVLFFAGDDPGAKTMFAALADELGFAPVDLGGLREGGRLMQAGAPSAIRADTTRRLPCD